MRIRLRPLAPSDPPVFAAAFDRIGWHKPAELYEHYLRLQSQGRRAVFVACVDGAVVTPDAVNYSVGGLSGGTFAGYVTLNWRPTYPPLAEAGLPEIADLNVLPDYRRRGIATALLDAAEQMAAERFEEIGIGVGLHPGYNAAQRLYAMRGYIPDGLGVTYREWPVTEGEVVPFDDDLVLHWTKRLTPHRLPARLAAP